MIGALKLDRHFSLGLIRSLYIALKDQELLTEEIMRLCQLLNKH